MRFGLCCALDDAPGAIDAGFDYVELGASALAEATDLASYRALPVECTNTFFPSSVRLFGVERTDYLAYVELLLRRTGGLGIEVMVIGSGQSRRAPEGEEHESDFADLAAHIQQLARPHGIQVAPESLNRSETNVGNDLGSLAEALHRRGTGFTADSYHVLFEWSTGGRRESLEQLWREQIPYRPTHVHVSNIERDVPDPSDPHLASFAERLRELGYESRISLECRRGPSFDPAVALHGLRALFA